MLDPLESKLKGDDLLRAILIDDIMEMRSLGFGDDNSRTVRWMRIKLAKLRFGSFWKHTIKKREIEIMPLP